MDISGDEAEIQLGPDILPSIPQLLFPAFFLKNPEIPLLRRLTTPRVPHSKSEELWRSFKFIPPVLLSRNFAAIAILDGIRFGGPESGPWTKARG